MATLTKRPQERQVGTVIVEAVISNAGDEVMAARGALPLDDVRTVTVDRFLVDTGATTLAIPISLIRQLGLRHLEDETVQTANGEATPGIYADAAVAYAGRRAAVECVELPDGAPPLLGCIPMEALGVEPDLVNGTLRLLPSRGKETYWLVL